MKSSTRLSRSENQLHANRGHSKSKTEALASSSSVLSNVSGLTYGQPGIRTQKALGTDGIQLGRHPSKKQGVFYLSDPTTGVSYLTVVSGENVLISNTKFQTPVPGHGPLAAGNKKQRKKMMMVQQLHAQIQRQRIKMNQRRTQSPPRRLEALDQSGLNSTEPGDFNLSNFYSTANFSAEYSPFQSTESGLPEKVAAGQPQSSWRPTGARVHRQTSHDTETSTITGLAPKDGGAWLEQMGAGAAGVADTARRREILTGFDREMAECAAALRGLDEESLHSKAADLAYRTKRGRGQGEGGGMLQPSTLATEPSVSLNIIGHSSSELTPLGRGIFDDPGRFPLLDRRAATKPARQKAKPRQMPGRNSRTMSSPAGSLLTPPRPLSTSIEDSPNQRAEKARARRRKKASKEKAALAAAAEGLSPTRRALRRELRAKAREPDAFLAAVRFDDAPDGATAAARAPAAAGAGPPAPSPAARARERAGLTREFAARFERAAARKKDFELYCYLADRYGPLPEPAFSRTERPGRLYVLSLRAAIRTVARFWRERASPRARARQAAALVVCSFVRLAAHRRRFLRVYSFRRRMLARRVPRKCLLAWRQQARLDKRVKALLHRANRERRHHWFSVWRKYLTLKKRRREERLLRHMRGVWLRLRQRLFLAWQQYWRRARRVRAMMRRVLFCPVFFTWRQHAQENRTRRKYVRVQALARGFLARAHRRKLLGVIRAVELLVQVHQAIRWRRRCHEELVEAWVARQAAERNAAAVKQELVRLRVSQDRVVRAEKEAYSNHQDFLRGPEGKALYQYEVKAMAERLRREAGGALVDTMPAEARRRAATALLQGRLGAVRANALADFCLAQPPPFACADPGCGDTFILLEHYDAHVGSAPEHFGLPDFVPLHQCLLDEARGVPALKEYLVAARGVGKGVFALETWLGAQAWREYPSRPAGPRVQAAVQLYNLHLRAEAPTRGPVSPGDTQEVEAALRQWQQAEARLNGGAGGGVFARKASVEYRPPSWPLSADLFAKAQWAAFLYLLDNEWEPFVESAPGRAYFEGLAAARAEREAAWRRQCARRMHAAYLLEAKQLKRQWKREHQEQKYVQFQESLRAETGFSPSLSPSPTSKVAVKVPAAMSSGRVALPTSSNPPTTGRRTPGRTTPAGTRGSSLERGSSLDSDQQLDYDLKPTDMQTFKEQTKQFRQQASQMRIREQQQQNDQKRAAQEQLLKEQGSSGSVSVNWN